MTFAIQGAVLMENLIQNPYALRWVAIVLMAVVPPATAMISIAWYKARKAECNVRKAELEASLKTQMLELGMRADEIERVLLCGTA
jgi:hypothetical protein